MTIATLGKPPRRVGLARTIKRMFTTGVNGAWYDPSDFSTMFQNAAGTTPVTAVGQPVGLMLDKSGRGNHAFNSSGNSANFPVLSARYNLLTKTEDFSDAVWSFANVGTGTGTKTANYGIAPDGTQTAARVQLSVGVLTDRAYFYQGIAAPASATQRWYIKTNDGSTKTITMAGVGTKQIIVTGSWQLFTSSDSVVVGANPGLILGNSTPTDLSADLLVWHPDVRVSNDALNQPAYQRVNTATDYDTVGFKPYLSFNGVNQWLQTDSIDFTGTDKMTAWAGVRKLSDVSVSILHELSADFNIRPNSLYLAAPFTSGVSGDYGAASRGTAARALGQVAKSEVLLAPNSAVITATEDISASLSKLRINGSSNGTNGSSNKGAGNFGNYPMYIGARAGTSLWFNGRLYGLVVAGKQASASEIAGTEVWLNQKTGAY